MSLLTLACHREENEAVWFLNMTADERLDIFNISVISVGAPRNNDT